MTDSSNHRSLDYWDDRWTTGKTGWQLTEPNPRLVKEASLLLPRPDKHRIFLPLCGKSVDLIWLYNQGHRVVGVEGVEQVVKEFGEEHNLDFQSSELEWGKLYQTPDHRLQVYVCDIFSLPAHELGRFDAVWDRGSLGAINEEDRDRYAAKMKLMLLPHFRYLLSVLDYTPTEEFSGPPCAVPPHQVHRLFGEVAQWKLLGTFDMSEAERFKKFNVGKMVENLILLSPKSSN